MSDPDPPPLRVIPRAHKLGLLRPDAALLTGTPGATRSVPESASQPARLTIDVTRHPCENADVVEGCGLGPLWVRCPAGNTR